MKLRSYVLTLVAIGALFAPVTLAQRGPADNTTALPGPGGATLSRTFTATRLQTPSGDVIGKAKTASVETTTGIKQGLRLQLTGLPAGVEYAIVIDSTLVGTATSNDVGILKFAMVSPSNGRVIEIPDAIKPITNIHTIQVFEVTRQQLVASGQFNADSSK